MPSYEQLQQVAKTRYGQDVPGAARKAMENTTPGSSLGNTELNGVAHALTGNSTEWHNQATFDALLTLLSTATAP